MAKKWYEDLRALPSKKAKKKKLWKDRKHWYDRAISSWRSNLNKPNKSRKSGTKYLYEQAMKDKEEK